MDRNTPQDAPGWDNHVFKGGYLVKCVCNPEAGKRCEFHAKLQPKACPENCGGILTRMTDGQCNLITFNKFANRWLPSKKAVWTCNTCEFCEVER